jgi:hypothetical protein
MNTRESKRLLPIETRGQDQVPSPGPSDNPANVIAARWLPEREKLRQQEPAPSLAEYQTGIGRNDIWTFVRQ